MPRRSAAKGQKLMTSHRFAPRGDIRLVYNSDGNAVDFFPLDPSGEEDLRVFTDDLAANGVDLYVQDVYWAGLSYYRSELCDPVALKDARRHDERLQAVFDLGLEPAQVWAKHSHENGMKFIAGFRMNDEHSGGNLSDPYRASMIGRFLKQSPQLWLKGHPGALDYSHAEARDYMLAVLREVVQRFDVDGLELNYIRHEHCFPAGTGPDRHSLMTEFLRRVRAMLDAAGRERRLMLGVMVPQTLDECQALGYDVPTWIRAGLIDYVAPSDFFYADFNARWEEFAALTRESNCMLFPTVHPRMCQGNHLWLLTPENYRAAARNMYAAGADGVEVFNYMYNWARIHGSPSGAPAGYPLTLSWLRELRVTEELDARARHYMFYPLWGEEPACPTGFVKNDHILLPREAGSSGEYRFRIAEDLSVPGTRAEVCVSARGLLPGDRVTLAINGTAVRAEKLMRIWKPDGRPEEHGREIGPYTAFMWSLTSPPATDGDNTLSVTFVSGDEQAREDIVIDEVEVTVMPPLAEREQECRVQNEGGRAE